MRAVVVRAFGGPEVMRVEQVADAAPGAGQLRVRIHAAGVNPVDAYIRTGTYARTPSLPYTPGMDFGGVVETIGTGVSRFRIGDRVYGHARDTHGAYAEAGLFVESDLEPLPDRASFEQGAALGVPYATAWRALFLRARAKAGETVLVHGASGGVGVAALQMARAAGLRVIGTAGTPEGVALARAQGAHAVVNHREAGYTDRLLELTGGRGADVILEMLANVNLDRDLDLVARYGRIVIIGNRGRADIDPRKIMGRDVNLLGMTLFNTTPAEMVEMHAALVAGLESGTLTPVVRDRLPLEEAPRAHAMVLEPGAHGKIVLVP